MTDNPSEPDSRLGLPDSDIACAARQFVFDVSPLFVAHHNVRSYLFARELAAAKGLQSDVDYDDELVFLSCILHDLGVTDYATAINGSKSMAPTPRRASCATMGCRKRGSPRSGRRLRCTPASVWRTSSVRNRPSPKWASQRTSSALTETCCRRVSRNGCTRPGHAMTLAMRWPKRRRLHRTARTSAHRRHLRASPPAARRSRQRPGQRHRCH